MTLRHTLALSFAAALIAAGFATTANAAATTTATPHHRHAVSHSTHMVAAHGHMHGKPTTAATGPDHSADSLNAQSLSRAQGATQ